MPGRVKRLFGEESWDEYYRRYQSALAEKYLIPVLRRWGVPLEGKHLLEVGGGDGGCGAAFHRAGCKVTSMDIDERLVRIAEQFNQRESLDISVYCGDVCNAEGAALQEGPFDIILLRDVIEHIDKPAAALEILEKQLHENGVIFVVFPPYYSPYGAHQQILPRKKFLFIPYNKLPYIQLLPDRLFLPLIKGETPPNLEVAHLRSLRLTLRKFEKLTAASGLHVRGRKLFFLRPTFNLRYGTPVAEASIFGRIPLLNELIVTAAYYMLGKHSRER